MNKELPEIGIVIPCYNEEYRIDIEKYNSYLKTNNHMTLLFVNDGSNDGTVHVLDKIIAKNVNASILNLDKNTGKAEAVRQGAILLLNGEFDYIGYWDSDLSTPLSEIDNFIHIFQNKLKVICVIGSRIFKLGSNIERKWYRHLFGRIITTILSYGPLKDISVYDSQCGAKIFKKNMGAKIFKNSFKTKWLFDVEILQRVKKQGSMDQIIIEYPLLQWIHRDGSKIKIKDFYKIIFEIVRLFKER